MTPPDPAAPRGPIMHVATRSTSVDELIERFAGLASEEALVLPAASDLPVGTEGRFMIHLKDRSVAMRGRCRVTDVQPAPPPEGAAGTTARRFMLRVALLEMDEESRAVHDRMLALRRAPIPMRSASETSARIEVSPARPRVPTPPISSRPVPPPPVHASIAKTLIGLPTGVRPPPIRLGGAPPLPSRETRVPGAAYTLPANPLSELELEDLSSLVEETLIESETTFPGTGGHEAAGKGGAAADGAGAQEAAKQPAPKAPRQPAVGAGMSKTLSQLRELAAKLPPPVRRFGPYVLVAIGSLLLGRALLRPPAPKPTAAKPVAAPVEPVAPPEPVAPQPPPAAKPAPAAAAASADCTTRVVTEPTDARVFWNGKLIGRSPISSAQIPCGPATVTFDRDRYQPASREVSAEPGKIAAVSEKLQRPPATLIVASSPPGAAITINKVAHGTAPRRIDVRRFERVAIEATLDGHARWTKNVYVKEPETKIDVQLAPSK